MNLYEMNKTGYAGLPSYTPEDLHQAKKLVVNFLKAHPSNYYLMLNNEENVHYYTLYTFKDGYKFSAMADEIIDISKDLGDIKSIENAEDGVSLEFWIMYHGECRVFYLFDYAGGVIEV